MSKDSSSKTNGLSPHLRVSALVVGTIITFLLGQFIGIFLLFALGSLFGYDIEKMQDGLTNSVVVQFLAAACIQGVTIGIIYLLCRFRSKGFLEFFGLNRKPTRIDLGLAAVSYVLYITAFVLIIPIVSVLIPSLDIEQSQQLGFVTPQGWELLLVFVSLVLFPSIVEELLFRGILFRGLRSSIGTVWAIAISSILFGIAHLEFLSGASLNWIAAVDTTIFAVLLCAVYIRAKSLWPAMMLHAIKNSIAFVVLFVF